MKKQIFFFCLMAVCTLTVWAQNTPTWVSQHPVNEFGYAGVGMARKSEANYIQKAKQNALADLASEIKIEVAANSLLNTLEDNGTIKQVYEESIRTIVKAEIEKYRMVDSWQDGDEYWVYYELSKFDYEEFMEARRQQAIKNGFDFWYRGNVMLEQGDLMSGIDLLTKAMEAIQPVLSQELLCSYDGKTINLSTEIYASLIGSFNGVTIVLNPTVVSGTAFKGISEPIAIGVYRNGNPLKKVQINAEFISGTGDLSSLPPTNDEGVAALYVRNITSKQTQQEIRISIDAKAFKYLQKDVYAAIFKKAMAMLPEAALTIKMEQKQLSAYVRMTQSDMDALERSVKSMLTNNLFNLVESPSAADVIVTLDNKLKKGRVVPGELYNFVEFFSTLGIQILNNRTNAVLLNYSLNDVRTLVPENKSLAQANSMATRELMKRLTAEFNRELKKLTIDTSGDIPVRKYAPNPKLPVPTVDQSEPVAGKPKPAIVPAIVPIIADAAKKEPNTQLPATIRGELTDGIWIEYAKIVHMGNRSRIHFKVINKTSDDFSLQLYWDRQNVVNESGEEMRVSNVKIGSKSNNYGLTALIVPNLPTELVFEVGSLKSVALFNVVDSDGHAVKLRNLK